MTSVRDSPLTGHNRLYIDPADNVMIGSAPILKYLGLRSVVTLYTWIEGWGLPVIKLPNGQFMTTMTAIDQWIFMAAEIDANNRTTSRGTNNRADRALILAQRRVEKHRLEAERLDARKNNGG